MPQVPYSPVPDITPTERGAPELRVSTPGAAFGTDIAEAVRGVGGELDKVGGELFTRAVALQELQNRSASDKANADFMESLGQREVAFRTLRGQSAANGYQQFIDDTHQLREQFGQSLNPMARRYYDSETRGQAARTIINAGIHAGEQQKQAIAGSAKAVLDANRQGAYAAPLDAAGFQEKWDAVPKYVATVAGSAGWDQQQTANEVFKERSALRAQQIIGLSDANPMKAEAMLKDAVANRELEYKDWAQVNAHVQHQVVTTGARNISDAVNAGFPAGWNHTVIDRAAGVQEPLLRIMKRALQNHPELDVTIPAEGGRRTPEEQAALVAKGTSKTYQSNHLTGRAIDLAPVGPDGKPNFDDKAGYAAIESAMKEASQELGIPLGPEHDQIRGWDPGHYSLPRDLDLASVPKAVEEPLQSRVDRAQSWARRMFPENAEIGDAVEHRVIGQFNQEKSIQRDFDFRNSTTVGNAILGGYGQKIPTTVEELKGLDPQVAAAYENLTPPMKRKVNGYLAQNSKQDYPQSEENFQKFMQLKGMAEADPYQFMGVDAAGLELPRAWRKQIWDLQQQKNKASTQDPRVSHALQVLAPTLQAAGIRQDKDRFYGFMGTLHDQLEQFQQENGKLPKDDEIQAIGARLLQEQHTHFWQSSQGFFEVPVPDDEAEKIRKDPKWSELGITPTDDMIQRVWVTKQYQERYGKPKPAKPAEGTEARNLPEVPQSK